MVRLRPFIRALRPTVYLIERWSSPSRRTHLPPLIVYTILLQKAIVLIKILQKVIIQAVELRWVRGNRVLMLR